METTLGVSQQFHQSPSLQSCPPILLYNHSTQALSSLHQYDALGTVVTSFWKLLHLSAWTRLSSFSSHHPSGFFLVSLATFPQPFKHGTPQGSVLSITCFTAYSHRLGDCTSLLFLTTIYKLMIPKFFSVAHISPLDFLLKL